MVKITKSFTIEIEKDGQTIAFGQDEIQALKSALEEALREKGHEARTKAQPNNSKSQVSEEKKKQIMDHVGKRLSSRPQTLSSLLNGISYAPNTLPFLRRMVEGRRDIRKKTEGKRTYYLRKS